MHLLLMLLGCTPSPEPPTEPLEEISAPYTMRRNRPPNVVFVLWDTVRADRLTPYGYKKNTTPFLARLARNGWVYERAISPAVWTLPAHSSLFTGMTVTEHGADGDYQRLDDDHITMAEALSAAGYDTFAFSANPFVTIDTGILQGFDIIHHPWDDVHVPASKRAYRRAQVDGDVNGGKGVSSANHWRYQVSADVAGYTFDGFLDARAGNNDVPFFAFFNLMEAHATRYPTGHARRQVMKPEVDAHARTLDQSSLAQLGWMAGTNPMSEEDLRALNSVYDASLLDLDRAFDRLYRSLDKWSLTDDTIIVFTSDHGEALGAHGRMGHQFHVYNDVSRVPLILSWGRHTKSGRIEAPQSTADLFKLVVDVGDLPIDAELRQALDDRAERRGGAVITEYATVLPTSLERLTSIDPKLPLEPFKTTYTAVEWSDHKIIESSDGSIELYEVVTDPHETASLEIPPLLDEGRELLQSWRAAHTPWKRQAEGAVFSDEMKAGLEALGYIAGEDP